MQMTKRKDQEKRGKGKRGGTQKRSVAHYECILEI